MSTKTTKTVDVAIVGGGLVGSVLALALAQKGINTALLEATTPQTSSEQWDSRIYAITPANAAFLQSLGVWDALDSARLTAIHTMQIWGDDSATPLAFDAYAAGVSELSWIAENRLLQTALLAALKRTPEVELIHPACCVAFTCAADAATLTLENDSTLTAKLVVAADGANSWLRQQAGIAVEHKPYFQQGVVANFMCEKPHQHIARQWFQRDGVLAWLPLPGRRMSMVWSLFDEQAHALLQLAPEKFCQIVAKAGNHELGEMQLITPPAAFPLALQRGSTLIAPRHPRGIAAIQAA